ncbi:MAG: sulfur transferase domain-containing protein [Gemmatimonadaceae bacterium]
MNEPDRDVAAVALPQGHMPLPGIVTSGQPNAGQLQELAAAGITTVIDLRAPNELRGFDEQALARASGLDYHNIPVTAESLAPPHFDHVRDLLRSPDKRPVLLHCASANRVGAILLPYLVLDEGRTPDEALQIAHRVGLRSDEMARTAFAYISDQENGRDAR